MHYAAAAAAALPHAAALRQRGGAAHRHRPSTQVLAAAASGSSSSSNGASGSSSSSNMSPLECSARLAAVRAAEQSHPVPLFADAFSIIALEGAAAAGAAAASTATAALDAPEQQREALATRFLDEQLLKAVTLVNLERDLTQEYNQVVLLGDGMDTRPFRLPWPEGTVMFCVAPAEVHAAAEAALKPAGARVPRGCLLRRVSAELHEGELFAEALERAGFRGDRLSVWALQGLTCLGLSSGQLTALLTDLCDLAAFDSLVTGLLPPLERRRLENLLASLGLLGAGVDFGPQTDWGRWSAELAMDPAAPRPWLFVAQQKRLSNREMGVYEDHVSAAEQVDEDFFGNFS